jgi:hypothetical protein
MNDVKKIINGRLYAAFAASFGRQKERYPKAGPTRSPNSDGIADCRIEG